METFQKLPGQIRRLVQNKRQISHSQYDMNHLVREDSFVAPENDLLIDAITALSMGKNILLKGPTGSGKTRLAGTLSNLFNQPMFHVNCSVDLDAESLLGFKTLAYDQGQQIIDFIPGPVTNSMEYGTFLYIDEINMAKPETLPLINGVLDYRRTITNPFTGKTMTAENGFGVIAAMNEGYVGSVPLNEALKNRFVVIDIPYLQDAQLQKLIENKSQLDDADTIDLFVRLSKDLLEAVSQNKLAEDAASIRALLDACDLSAFIPPKRAIQRAIADKLEENREKEFITALADTLFND